MAKRTTVAELKKEVEKLRADVGTPDGVQVSLYSRFASLHNSKTVQDHLMETLDTRIGELHTMVLDLRTAHECLEKGHVWHTVIRRTQIRQSRPPGACTGARNDSFEATACCLRCGRAEQVYMDNDRKGRRQLRKWKKAHKPS